MEVRLRTFPLFATVRATNAIGPSRTATMASGVHMSNQLSSGAAPAQPGFIRLYHLLLHRTATAPMLAIAQAMRSLFRFAEAEAMTRMWEAQHCGQAVVVTTYFERAEYFAERFAERGLRATVVPA